MWIREEALATILSVEMLELPVSDTEARFEEEFGAADSNIVSMFIQRLTTQLSQFASFANNQVTHVLSGHIPSSFSGQQNRKLIRDEFNLHKIIVIVSSAGKVVFTKWSSCLQIFCFIGRLIIFLFVVVRHG